MQRTHSFQILRRTSLLTLALLCFSGPLPLQAQKHAPAGVSVKLVDYDAMGKIVSGFPGKVVVVDFWSTT